MNRIWIGIAAMVAQTAAAVVLAPQACAQPGARQIVRASIVAPKDISASKPFEVVVRLQVADGYHIQSNNPAAGYIATNVKLSLPQGWTVSAAQYPAAITVEVAGETIPVFEGRTDVTFQVTPPKGAAESASATADVAYQGCDATSCFPPSDTSASAVLGLLGAPSTPVPDKPVVPPGPAAQPGVSTSAGVVPPPPTALDSPSPDKPAPDGGGAGSTAPEAAGSASVTPDAGSPEQFDGYAMAKITEFVGPAKFEAFLKTGSTGAPEAAAGLTRLLNKGNMVLALPLIFLLGLALNLTPCVYPIIPITISYFGSQTGSGRRPVVLALFYVLGMASMYSLLGVAAGLTGGLFGQQLQNPWVLAGFAAVMFALALSQFDRKNGMPIWEFQLPAGLRNKAQTRSGVLGALLMGVMVGVVAAPCIGPAVIALLQWVGAQKSALLGFLVFFFLALGLGVPYVFLALASGSVKKLPRSGEWMVGVKHLFGVVMIWMGVYYLETVLDMAAAGAGKAALVGVTALSAVYLLAVDKAGASAPRFVLFRRLAGIGAVVLTVVLAKPAPETAIRWQPLTDAALQTAMNEKKPVLIDFTAAWCAACKELDHKTFSDKAVGAAAQGFVAFKADMTNFQGAQSARWQKTYGIGGLPTVVRLVPGG